MIRKMFFLWLGVSLGCWGDSVSFELLKESARSHSLRLHMRTLDQQIEQAKLGDVYAQYYPQIFLNYNSEYNHNLDSAMSGYLSVGGTSINATVPYKHSAALGLNYELYHFGSTTKQVKIQEAIIETKRYEVCQEVEKLYRDILDRYVDALKAQNEIMIKSQMVIERKSLYAIRERLYRAGKETRLSVGDEAIKLVDLQSDIERATVRFNEDILALSSLSHKEISDKTIFAPLHILSNTIPLRTFETTPQAQAYKEKIQQKEEEISLNLRSHLPTITLYSNYYMYGSDMNAPSQAWNNFHANSWNAGIGIRGSLFEGFKYRSTDQRLVLEKERLRHEYEQMKRDFDYQTRIYQQSIDRMSILNDTNQVALREAYEKLHMIERLRTQGEADAVSETTLHLELLERTLALTNDTIQREYQMQALQIQQMGDLECQNLF